MKKFPRSRYSIKAGARAARKGFYNTVYPRYKTKKFIIYWESELCFIECPHRVMAFLKYLEDFVSEITAKNKPYVLEINFDSAKVESIEVLVTAFLYLIELLYKTRFPNDVRIVMDMNHPNASVIKASGIIKSRRDGKGGTIADADIKANLTPFDPKSEVDVDLLADSCQVLNDIKCHSLAGGDVRLGDHITVALKESAMNSLSHGMRWGVDKKSTYIFFKPTVHPTAGYQVVMMIDLGTGVLNTVKDYDFKELLGDLRDLSTLFTKEPKDRNRIRALFDGKYGSSTKDPNRQSGMPVIFAPATMSAVTAFCCLTNKLILTSQSQSVSRSTITSNDFNFPGTVYVYRIQKQ